MANIITCFRIVCAVIMFVFPAFSKWFYISYLLGSASDVTDGFIARHFDKETKLGAKLDTAADIIFTLVLLIKIMFSYHFPVWQTIWIICIAIIKSANVAMGFAMYKELVYEHTFMNKLSGILLFFIPLCMGFIPWAAQIFITITCFVCTFAAIHEGYLIYRGLAIE